MLLLDPESGIHTDPKKGTAYVVGTDDDDSSLGGKPYRRDPDSFG